jgi:hypothetical protein
MFRNTDNAPSGSAKCGSGLGRSDRRSRFALEFRGTRASFKILVSVAAYMNWRLYNFGGSTSLDLVKRINEKDLFSVL